MVSISAQVEEATPVGIAGALSRMITSGELAPGTRLPTVRDLAADLGVSPATVSLAWRTLRTAGLVTSRGRSGSFVRSGTRAWLPSRYRGLDGSYAARLDLSRGTPDPLLLPSIGEVLEQAAVESRRSERTGTYLRKPDIAPLHDLLRETWPGPVESLTVTNGALDGIDRALGALVHFGDRVAVESPTFPPFLDLLEAHGLAPVPFDLDACGPRVPSFRVALRRAPAVVLLQPRAHNPTGVSTTPERAEALAGVLRRTREADRAVVVEDDHAWAISSAPMVSLGRWLPDRVVHVRSFSKSHGPDLRIGALGGPREIVDRIVSRRLLGPGWTSRLTQSLLWGLLTHPDALATVERAREAYAARQRSFSESLARQGVSMPVADGLNAWLPVSLEQSALTHLVAAGILVAPGSPFEVTNPAQGREHVRVTVGVVAEGLADVAAHLAEVARR
ncbi:Transcriptional regulator with HTH domain and aminotransferase domain [Nostocoides japonicum T1-X7]|uniref:Transcriptional regulator with HTH domain and aminotransferase domain n=1 Tax=Nostocoides japonicum T1-X7 TaxID=1194083 RepID=A0A077M3R8_9MICO|nr:aminotransferase class I/II-fold pyridoxal phosphate-dependent enzyme [Tetrasphaera japonica]CCH78829.1 Transcriptional regulator with HTH domain and aminotransferase domain [Tetrasphaera japonica T1-X7]